MKTNQTAAEKSKTRMEQWLAQKLVPALLKSFRFMAGC
jgi:hypothetical protein